MEEREGREREGESGLSFGRTVEGRAKGQGGDGGAEATAATAAAAKTTCCCARGASNWPRAPEGLKIFWGVY